jgi:hypothetical protein
MKQAIGVRLLGVALVDQGFTRDECGGEMLDDGSER